MLPMDVRLIVSASSDVILSFLIKNRDVSEIKVEKKTERRIVGSIFKGKVKRLAKSLDGAFVDIGLGREAYLPLKNYSGEEDRCSVPEVGEELVVQVKREPIEEKGAKITCRVTIPGKYLVYLPGSKGVFVSSKIGDEGKKKFFLELFKDKLNEEGVIVRTSATKASKEDLIGELEKLRKKWEKIKEKASKVKTGIVYEEVPLFMQTIRDWWQDIEEIVVDDRDIWIQLLAFLEEDFPELVEKVRYVKNISVFFKRYNLDRILTKLFAKYVWLKNGGYIVIEETEAMTVIDVNSGSGSGESLEENALKTNLEAAEEIARQIKLRDIGGIVIIDFIDMKDKKSRETLIKKMKELFADEGSNVHIYGITQLGLLEMTRKKETPSVTKLLSLSCPYCKGRGYIKSPELVLYEIEKELDYFKGRYLELKVNPLLKERVEKLLEKKNMKGWVSLKEECDVPLDYYEMMLSG